MVFSGHSLFAEKAHELDLRKHSAISTDSVSPLVERTGVQYLCNIDLLQTAETRLINDRIETIIPIKFDGAEHISFFFSRFVIPLGSYLIVRNVLTSEETKYNRTKSGILTTDELPGSRFELQISQPAGSAPIQFRLSSFGISTEPMNLSIAPNTLKSSSGACNIDIACTEGAPWRQIGGSICRLIINNSINCTGTLINNTADDGKFYVLTANHCISNAISAQNTRFTFNYENEVCGGKPLKGTSVSGAWLRATSPDKSLDFALLELYEPVPPSAKIYYAGWDARDENLTNPVVSIHHPRGDVKKISKSKDIPLTAWYQNKLLSYKLVKDSHWQVKTWKFGTTEVGSSGSAIFDSEQHIVGTLTGGDAECGWPYNDFFQKFSYSWDYFTDSSQQLKYWLDPINSGTTILNGSSQCDYCEGGTDNLFILSNMQSTGYIFGSVPDDNAEFGHFFNKSRDYLSAIGVYVGHNTLTASDTVYVKIYSYDAGQLNLLQQYPIQGNKIHAYADNRITLPQSVPMPNLFFVSLHIPQTDNSVFSLYTNAISGTDPLTMVKQYGLWMSAADLAVGCELPMCIYTTNKEYDTQLKMAYIEEKIYTGARPEFAYPYDSILIYPNPNTDGMVKIEMQGVLDKQVRITVISGNGIVVGTMIRDLTIAGNVMSCDFSNLPAGIYTIRFELENDAIYRKLVIQK